jgi:hypothetical protein
MQRHSINFWIQGVADATEHFLSAEQTNPMNWEK